MATFFFFSLYKSGAIRKPGWKLSGDYPRSALARTALSSQSWYSKKANFRRSVPSAVSTKIEVRPPSFLVTQCKDLCGVQTWSHRAKRPQCPRGCPLWANKCAYLKNNPRRTRDVLEIFPTILRGRRTAARAQAKVQRLALQKGGLRAAKAKGAIG